MHARLYWKQRHVTCLIGAVFTASIFISIYHFIGHDCLLSSYCNNTQLTDSCYAIDDAKWQVNTTRSPATIVYVRISKAINVILVVVIPIAAVAALNVSLIFVLKRRDLQPTLNENFSFRRYSDIVNRNRQERKVTATICLIVTCFTLTQVLIHYVYISTIPIGSIGNCVRLGTYRQLSRTALFTVGQHCEQFGRDR